MSHAFSRGLASALAAVPFLIACGGNSGTPGAINSAQCSGPNCPVQGPPPSTPAANALCPATADIAKNTYLGGAGSGEVVSLNIDATAMAYKLTWLESPIPVAAGATQPTRAGITVSGNLAHPPAGFLPTAEQTRCAFILLPGSGTVPPHTPANPTFDGTTYTTATNPLNPPMILVGQGGVAGGGIPGAEISFSGLVFDAFTSPLFPIPDRKFDFYPFIGFATVDTNLTDLAGTYNSLMYHIQPTKTYKAVGTQSVETFDANGACTSPSGACVTTGQPWTANAAGTYFTSALAPQTTGPNVAHVEDLIIPGGIPLTLPIAANANMILGKVNGALVPLIIRTGVADPSNIVLDDESGIALLSPASAVTSGAIDGGYVGADSNFKYTATLLKGATGTFINPSTQAAESGFSLQYGGANPGLVTAADAQSGTNGFVISAGSLYAVLMQGTTGNEVENGGITASSAIPGQTTSSMPYFGIGAQISK